MINTFLFDIDGTLLDTKEFILQAFEYILKKNNFDVPDRGVISSMVGMDFHEMYSILSGIPAKDTQYLIDSHRKFQVENTHLSVVYPNTISVLEKLKNKNYKLAFITSRSKQTSEKTLEEAGILKFFDIGVSVEDAPEAKPSPVPLLMAMEKLSSKPDETVMVGDSHFDVEAGINAGTKTIRCTYGFHTDHIDTPKPDFMIDDIGELLKIVEWSTLEVDHLVY